MDGMKEKTVSLGIIGCGKVAQGRHLPALKTIKEVRVVSLCDNNEDHLEQAGQKYRIKKRFLDYQELLADSEVEAVAVCTPLQSHFEIAKAVLGHGKHLLLEKPLALTLEEADQLVDRSAASGKKVMLGLNLRWHRLVRRSKRIIAGGALGPIRLVNCALSTAHFGRSIPDWRLKRAQGGGNLIENGTHIYDLWRYLLEDEIEEVQAVSLSSGEADDEPAAVTARTAKGAVLNAVLSDFLPDENRLDIFGQNSLLRLSLHRFDGLEIRPLYSNAGSLKVRLRNAANFIRSVPGAVSQSRYGGFFDSTFRDQWQHFIGCILHNRPSACTFEDGRRALQVALAAVESARAGKGVEVRPAL